MPVYSQTAASATAKTLPHAAGAGAFDPTTISGLRQQLALEIATIHASEEQVEAANPPNASALIARAHALRSNGATLDAELARMQGSDALISARKSLRTFMGQARGFYVELARAGIATNQLAGLGDASAPSRGKYLVAAGAAFAVGVGVLIWAATRGGSSAGVGNAPKPIKPIKLKRVIPAR